jgi:hypothetical protein
MSDLSPLAACSGTLEELWMAGNPQIRSLDALKACTRLCKLDLRGCHPALNSQVEGLQLLACSQLADPQSVELQGLVHELQPNMPTIMQDDAAFDLMERTDNEDSFEAMHAIAAAGAIPALVLLLGSDSSEVQMFKCSLGNLACDHLGPLYSVDVQLERVCTGMYQTVTPSMHVFRKRIMMDPAGTQHALRCCSTAF